MAGGTTTERSGTGRLAAVAQWWRSALSSSGDERDTLLMIAKSTLAATLAWLISYDVLDARSPAFAPFSAVLMMQVTVYRSVVQSLRYVGAVVAGVLVQAALGFLAGPDLLTFVLVALIALTIGRWTLLGVQGPQVATAAFFAFSTYTSASGDPQRLRALGEIVLLVLIGSAIGTAVNVLVAPPLRHRSAEYGIRSLAHTLHGLLADMHPVLAEGVPDEETTGGWRTRAARTGEMIGEARSGLLTSKESALLNPRRLLRRHRGHPGFQGYEFVLGALERTLYQVASLTRGLDRSRTEDEARGPFLQRYAAFLESVGAVAEVLITLDETTLLPQAKRLERLTDEAEARRDQVVEETRRLSLSLADPSAPYGILVTEATRLLEEFRYTSQVLLDVAQQADRTPGSTLR
ncbi:MULTISPECIES: aromatic acid exporter family protein [Streptomyces]|uniref:Aromatic acid exporter family protein n=1 Tax=Streptomyces glycanivorans TaxID=3033808 RepID=A0ABY9JHY3_9ACTN|nr:aromatic acid exporter family protein [Streptomyces sp. Alt3]WLQ65656.1 aromatic acid exporter family protein [Streptomyces sp. Alt3]WSQ79072.1 aromatic acid exporter family protein [Streptomyces sp. NBC_01213]